MAYMQQHGYRIVPVNPKVAAAGGSILGETAYASLADVPVAVDMVDVFRAPEHADAVCKEAVAVGARCLWLQLDVRCETARARAEAAGLRVVMDRCPKIEHARLAGSLG
jgi:predicted CoA-binding protein